MKIEAQKDLEKLQHDKEVQTEPETEVRKNSEKSQCHEGVQTKPEISFPFIESKKSSAPEGTLDNPFVVNDDCDFDDHGAVSGDEEEVMEPGQASNPIDDDKFFFGTAFEKVEEFDPHLDDPNPWHPDLKKPLFDSQTIGFRWMVSRHPKGGGLIGDKVGCGKVISDCSCPFDFHEKCIEL